MRAVPVVSIALALAFPTRAEHAAPPPLPGPERAALVVPDEALDRLLAGAGLPGGALGIGPDRLAQFGRDRLRLPTVTAFFADVRAIPRESGRIAEALVKAAGDPAEVARQAFLLTDVSAGRMLPLPEGWGLAGAAADATPGDALEAALAALEREGPRRARRLSAAQRAQWDRLPVPAQRFVVRLLVAASEARPWLRAANDEAGLRAAVGAPPGVEPSAEALYRFAIAPWEDERLGQLATLERASIDMLSRTDREYLAFGTAILLERLKQATDELAAAGGPGQVPAGWPGLDLATGLGLVRVGGPGADRHEEPAVVAVDLGGDDVWLGRHGAAVSLDVPLSLAVDLGGDDTWDGGDRACAIGCGLFGAGVVADLAGHDRYAVRESGLGCGWHGAGILLDAGGNDTYSTREEWGQGAAHAGIGVLLERAGDDTYESGSQSQGLGSTLGAGVLLDVAGNDRYVARDDGNVSELYLHQSVAMCQGVGYGRRADLGDGHSLAGGFGVLVDGEGDDSYHAQVWSQGAGYWWAVGICEDLGGDDRWENGKYSAGAAAHFAVGSCVDLSGDDVYNQGVATTKNQFQGHARDGSIGVFVDGDGNDRYLLRSHCGGSGDLASIGFFWDRRGDDVYELRYEAPETADGWADTPPLGTATAYPPFRSFRDDVPAVGLFLDTGGTDRYEGGKTPARDGATWTSRRGPASSGCGMDLGWW